MATLSESVEVVLSDLDTFVEVAQCPPGPDYRTLPNLKIAFRTRALGQARFSPTTSEVEGLACCHSAIAGG